VSVDVDEGVNVHVAVGVAVSVAVEVRLDVGVGLLVNVSPIVSRRSALGYSVRLMRTGIAKAAMLTTRNTAMSK
jgi:hypothetical protein